MCRVRAPSARFQPVVVRSEADAYRAVSMCRTHTGRALRSPCNCVRPIPLSLGTVMSQGGCSAANRFSGAALRKCVDSRKRGRCFYPPVKEIRTPSGAGQESGKLQSTADHHRPHSPRAQPEFPRPSGMPTDPVLSYREGARPVNSSAGKPRVGNSFGLTNGYMFTPRYCTT